MLEEAKKFTKEHHMIEEGGRIVAAGTPEEIKNAPQSVTGKYL